MPSYRPINRIIQERVSKRKLMVKLKTGQATYLSLLAHIVSDANIIILIYICWELYINIIPQKANFSKKNIHLETPFSLGNCKLNPHHLFHLFVLICCARLVIKPFSHMYQMSFSSVFVRLTTHPHRSFIHVVYLQYYSDSDLQF